MENPESGAPPAVAPTEIPLDTLAKVYRKIKAKIDERTKVFDTEIETLKQQQTEIKLAMKDILLRMQVKSANTEHGTVILTAKHRFSTSDWDSFKKFVREHDALDLFEKRIHQGNMEQFLKDNPSLHPPGLNSDTEFDVSVRKPTNN